MYLPPMVSSPFGDIFQTGNHTQQRRFATTGRPYEDDELAFFDIEIDVTRVSFSEEVIIILANIIRTTSAMSRSAV
jgi:hypothetical protein